MQRSTRTPASRSAGYQRVVSSHTQRTGAGSRSRTKPGRSVGREPGDAHRRAGVGLLAASTAPSPRRRRTTRFTLAVSPRPPTGGGGLSAEHAPQARPRLADRPAGHATGHGSGGPDQVDPEAQQVRVLGRPRRGSPGRREARRAGGAGPDAPGGADRPRCAAAEPAARRTTGWRGRPATPASSGPSRRSGRAHGRGRFASRHRGQL